MLGTLVSAQPTTPVLQDYGLAIQRQIADLMQQ